MKQLFTAIAILILFANCNKKTLPESTTGKPVFLFAGSIDNQPVKYVAGDSTLYMFTEFYKDNQDLVTLKGFFSPYNCITCEPYLSFEFKDENPNLETKLYSDIYSFFERSYFTSVSFDSIIVNSPTESFKFIADNNPPGTTYRWNFGDGDTSNQISPVHTFLTGGVKNVQLVTTLNNLKDTISIPIDVTPFSECRNKFNITIDSADSITVNAEGLFNSYVWFFGDGSTSSGQTANHTYNANGIYEVTLNTSGVGCLATFKRKVNLSGNNLVPVSNFYYSNYVSSETKLIPRVNHSTCIITLLKDGKTYKSYKNNSTQDQSIKKIISTSNVMPYENNLQGHKTLKLDGQIDLFLYNVNNNNDSIPIKSDSLRIAIAFPS